MLNQRKHGISFETAAYVFDEDSPELSPAMYKAFKSSVIHRNRQKNA